MKKLISYITILSLAFAAFSCTEKEEESGTDQPEAKMTGMFYAKATADEIIEIIPGKTKVVDVRAYADTTNGSVSDIALRMSFKGDADAVAAYNSANNTDYSACPGSAYEFTSNDVMMPKYGVSSTTAKLKLSTSGMEDGVTYVLPIVIDKVTGTDKWEQSPNPYAYVLVKMAYVAPDAGLGTKDSPYNIYNTADIVAMHDKLGEDDVKTYFRLQADIDMEGVKWMPLNYSQPYKKLIDFDGNGHTISNFYCDFANYPSFFGVLYGSIYNVTFTNAQVESQTGGATGILGSYCGTTDLPGEAHHVHVQGKVTSPGGNKNGTGGLFGRIWGASITACSVDVEIESGEDYVGGIFGYDTGASVISDCWSTGTLIAGSKVGGIGGGFIKAESAVYNCYTTMKVKGSFQIGGILGHANLDQKNANDTNEPNNHVERCIVWSDSLASKNTDTDEHYSSGAIVGYTACKNYLVDCYRKADLKFVECPKNIELGYGLTNQENAGPTSPMAHGSNTYDFAYHGKAAGASVTLSSLAKQLGWSEDIWDFSGSLPVLKAGASGGSGGGEDDSSVDAGGQLPDFDEHDFYN